MGRAVTYEGIELPVQSTLAYFRTNGAAKVAAVAARHDDDIPLPAWATYSIQDPRRSIGNWPALLVDGIQSKNDTRPGASATARLYQIGIYVIAKGSGEEDAKTCAQRYMVAMIELLREMHDAHTDGIRWIWTGPDKPQENYVQTFVASGSRGYLSDARLIAVCSSPMGDDWPCN